MRILHVVDHSIPLHSGYTFRSRAIFNAQRQRGWETEHLSGPKHAQAVTDQPDEEVVDGLHFFRTPLYSKLLYKLPVANQYAVVRDLAKRLEVIARQVKPDVIHAHSPALNGVAAIRVGRKLGIPVVYEIRGFWEDAAVSHGTAKEGDLRYRLTRGMENWVIRRANHVCCICAGLRGDLIARGTSAERITIIPNAVNIESFQPVEKRNWELEAALGLQDKPTLGFIGSYYYYEGLDLLVTALATVRQRHPSAMLVMVGGGPAEAGLKEQVAAAGLTDAVLFVGRVPQEKVSDYYSLIDVLAYPRQSLRITELVTPLKPLEAMAQKRLFVASDVGGHRELIVDGETGVLHTADDSASLADKICWVFENPDRWAAMKDAGRRFVETQRNWQVSVANYESVYASLEPVS